MSRPMTLNESHLPSTSFFRLFSVLALLVSAGAAFGVDATQLTSDAETTFSSLKVVGRIAVGLVCLVIIGVCGWKMGKGGDWAAGVVGLIALIFVIGAYAIVESVFG